MLYPENQAQTLSGEVFKNPGAEYRATPFWAWNCELNQATLNRQIDCMKEMGFGGFHMHVRVGMTTRYLSDGFMAFIKGCVEKAEQNDMLAWLYDEDKWPSGFAGGLVTNDPAMREKFLRFTETPYGAGVEAPEHTVPLGRYAITLDEDGCLEAYARLAEGEQAPEGAKVRYAYLEIQSPSNWFNRQSYVDTLSPAAIKRFIDVTHERYNDVVGEEFGKRVPAIFTDEPQFRGKGTLTEPFSANNVILPWTDDFTQTYQAVYGEDILEALPELVWELPEDGVSQARYRYHDHIAERFAAAFADQIGQWCEEHNLMLTGHMMSEESLRSQTVCLGDCMRSYRGFQLPGIDMLCDKRELTTAKQAQSAAHQYARPGVLSELYGVTNWDFPFRKHKLQGDWQAAMGVSVRVPHLYWVSMRGEAKRDYPASIGHQSPWYAQYKYLEDHFARVNAAMTRGRPLVKIAVIHPVESYWLHWGPSAQTEGKRQAMDDRFHQLTEWLCYSMLDFDFICESLLPDQFDPQGEGFQVGAMTYDVVIVPNLETVRSTTVEALKQFSEQGGQVLFLGDVPGYVDAEESAAACELAWENPDSLLPWSEPALLDALEPYRLLSVTNKRGTPADNLLSQWREDTDGRWLFLCHAKNLDAYYATEGRVLTLRIAGEWNVTLYDSLTGEIRALPAERGDGETTLVWYACQHDSILLKLTPPTDEPDCKCVTDGETTKPRMMEEVETARNRERDAAPEGAFTIHEAAPLRWSEAALLPSKLPVTLSEPNVLVLDMPEYSLNGEPWRGAEEVLRIADSCKRRLGLNNEIAGGCQPWVLAGDPDAVPAHTLRLRHTIRSEQSLETVQLAAEDLETLTITWNGLPITPVAEGWYVDEAIRTVSLPGLRLGENLLEIEIPFGKVTTVENCFLLGDFGVRVLGREALITAPVRELAFGDWVSQGLPFYGGNVTYHAEIEADGGPLALEAHHFCQPTLSVALDGAKMGVIALSPYRCALGKPAPGKHALALTAYGNRINTFGGLHNVDYAATWHGPHAWRVDGHNWSYEYRLRPGGVTAAPWVLQGR